MPVEGFSLLSTDCDDSRCAAEVCDGRDNNCDGVADDGTEDTERLPDLDGDGWGDPEGPVDTVWTPSEITDLPGNVVEMALGLTHTCAILDTFRVVCWGGNGAGQLGAGDTDPKSGYVFVTGLP